MFRRRIEPDTRCNKCRYYFFGSDYYSDSLYVRCRYYNMVQYAHRNETRYELIDIARNKCKGKEFKPRPPKVHWWNKFRRKL